jgi:AcrR family transcriptional regulator
MKTAGKGENSRTRLIEAAGSLFAEKGFKGATIRDICKMAGTNIASVNYHFKGKDHLFQEVIVHIIKTGWTKYPVDYGISDAKMPEDKLRTFIRTFLQRRFDPDRPAWQDKLLRREVLVISPRPRKSLSKYIVKNDELLLSIVKDLLGSNASEEIVRLCSASVIGQMLIFTHPKPDGKHPFNYSPQTPQGIEKVTKHIAEFSLAGIREVKKKLMRQRRKA